MEQSLNELTALKEQLRHQAYHDALTGLPNRTLFTEHVAQALSSRHRHRAPGRALPRSRRLQAVNDSYGHNAGDELLKAVGERIASLHPSARRPGAPGRRRVRHPGAWAREEDAERIAQRIVDAARGDVLRRGPDALVHASVGLASGGRRIGDELLRNADVAMYAAKQGGKRRTCSSRRRCTSGCAPDRARRRARAGHRERRDRRPLPADRRARRPAPGRSRGARPLGPRGARRDPAGELHPARRGDSA